MKNIICLVTILFAYSQLSAQKLDSMALTVVETNLKTVSEYLDKKDTSLQKISKATMFFTDLTGIQSEVHGKYYGQFRPTKNDLNLWTLWLKVNKEYIFWDKETKSIILYKKVRAGII